MLIVGPSTHFLAYISEVLPSLGETGVVSAVTTIKLATFNAKSDTTTDVSKLAEQIEDLTRDHGIDAWVIQEVDGPYGPMTLIGSGFKLAHGGGSIDRPPATLGEHAEEILGEADYSDGEIADMRAAGVI